MLRNLFKRKATTYEVLSRKQEKPLTDRDVMGLSETLEWLEDKRLTVEANRVIHLVASNDRCKGIMLKNNLEIHKIKRNHYE